MGRDSDSNRCSNRRVVVGMAGVEGLGYGIRLLETLHEASAETHLVLTAEAEEALLCHLNALRSLAHQVHSPQNQAARISSGSFLTQGMVVAPCDTDALAAISMGLAKNLVFRAADVTLKERRPLVLGLTHAPRTSTEIQSFERVRRVPGVVVTALEGPEALAATTLLCQLGFHSEPSTQRTRSVEGPNSKNVPSHRQPGTRNGV